MVKKYFWLKLKEDFFRQKEIKKLRRIAGGDTYTVIYLKLQLLSLKNEGKLFFEGIEDNFVEEMALELDEDIENVKVTLMFLEKYGLLQLVNAEEYHLPQTIASIGSEVDSAERVRKHRKKKEQQKALPGNGKVTNGNTELEIDIEIDKTQVVFEHWINKNIVKHRELTPNIKKEINKALKKHSIEEIKTAIDNYSKAYYDKDFYYKHRWTLDTFMKQSNGYINWLDEGLMKIRHNDSKKQNKPKSELDSAKIAR